MSFPHWKAVTLLLMFSIGMVSIISLGKQLVAEGIHPLALSAWQNFIAGCLLLIWGCARNIRGGLRSGFKAKDLSYFAIAAIFGIAVPHTIVFYVISDLGASITAITYLFPPLLTYAMALCVRMDTLGPRRVLGLMLGFLGSVLLFLDQGLFTATGHIGVLLIAYLAPFSMAAGNIFRSRYWPEQRSIFIYSGTILICAGLSTMIPAAAFGTLRIEIPLSDFGLLALTLSVASSALGYVCFFHLQKNTGPVYVSQAGYIIAALGIVVGAVLFREPIPKITFVAVALIALGIYCYSLKSMQRTSRPTGDLDDL